MPCGGFPQLPGPDSVSNCSRYNHASVDIPLYTIEPRLHDELVPLSVLCSNLFTVVCLVV